MKKSYLSPLLLLFAFLGSSAMGMTDREYLETFDLKELEVVRTETGKCSWALIKTPDGYTHYAKEGNYIGKNYGRIIGIHKDKIRIKELIEDGKGDWEDRFAFLKVKPSAPVKERRFEYLETFDLKELKVVWVETRKCSWVSIKAPNGYMYGARVGNYLGQNKGRLINIFNDGIRVKELEKLDQGRSEERIIFIKAKERPKVGGLIEVDE
jgi:Tfp pilus assembly protein PilP